MFEPPTLRKGFVTSLLVLSLGLSACSSDDDDDGPGALADPTVDDGTDTGEGTTTGAGAGAGTTTDTGTGTTTDTGTGAGTTTDTGTGDGTTTETDAGGDTGTTTGTGAGGDTDDGTTTDTGAGGDTDDGTTTDTGADGGTDDGTTTDTTDTGGVTDDGTDGDTGTVETVAVTLDPASTVPPAVGADDATGTGEFTIDTETGAISGIVTVSGTTGVPTVAHIHDGAPGVAGPILIPLDSNDDGTVWTIPEGSALDAAGIEAFEQGNLYINVHTEENPAGELRAQLPASGGGDGDAGGDTDTAGGDGTDGTGDTGDEAQTVALTLDSSSTVPPAEGADDAAGTGGFTVDSETGAISGSVTVSGTTGEPTMADIRLGAAGETGDIVVPLEPNNPDSTVWIVPEGAALDAAGIAAFEEGNLYVNVVTDANPDGELRAQLVGDSEGTPASGSITVSFRNLSEFQPMTPPVVILHNAPDSENGIRYFELGDVVGEEVRQIAEDGNITPLVENAQGQIATGRVSAVEAAPPEAGGPLLPGGTSSVTLTQDVPDQVLSIVVMVVCTNDGFTGVDSIDITEGSFTTPVYDAGSETNVETLDYWVPPCGTETNLTDQENGVITIHPGQSDAENPDFNFPVDSELLEITISVNE